MANSMSQELKSLGLKPSSATYSVTLDDLPRLSFLNCQMKLMIPFVLPIASAGTTFPLDTYIAALLPSFMSLFNLHLFRETFPDLHR